MKEELSCDEQERTDVLLAQNYVAHESHEVLHTEKTFRTLDTHALLVFDRTSELDAIPEIWIKSFIWFRQCEQTNSYFAHEISRNVAVFAQSRGTFTFRSEPQPVSSSC